MKNYRHSIFLGGVITKLISFVILMLAANCSYSQSIFTPVDTTVHPLTDSQRVIYNLAREFGSYYKYQFVHVGSLAAAHKDSTLLMSFSGLSYGDSVEYVTHDLQYVMDTSFYWYGQVHHKDSTGTQYYKGEAMLFTYGGQYYGYLIANNQNFEIIDLSGGLQMIAEVDLRDTTRRHCGTSDVVTARTTAEELTSGIQCSPRVLILFTSVALNNDPMHWARGQLAFNQTKQALKNSNVSTFRMNLQLAGMFYTSYSESIYNSSQPTTTGLNKDYKELYKTPGSAFLTNVNFWSSVFSADLVVVMRRFSLENTQGIAAQSDPPYFNYKYAIVQSTSATTAGYTFAHEVGHLMGATHGDDPIDPDYYTYPSTSNAHWWFYSTTTGSWPFNKNWSNWGWSITYQGTAGNTGVILQYSNPNLSDHGQPTGIVSDRDAAQTFRDAGCSIAGNDPTPDAFTIAVGPDDRPKANNGNSIFCYGRSFTLTSYVTGPTGTYTYYWEWSVNGGTTYTAIPAGTSAAITQTFLTTGNYIYRVTVTTPGGGQSKTIYYPISVIYCPSWFPKISPETFTTELINVLPNPANDAFTVKFSLAQEGKAFIGLYDMTGRLVKEVCNGTRAEGEQQITTGTTALSSGFYQLKFQADNVTRSVKIAVQH